jgi:tripartite-type tricarboxylate transporter receptor subunit TctC
MKFPMLAAQRRRVLAALATTAVLPVRTWAQSERAVRLIVASSAGSTIDAIARSVQPTLSTALGAPLVIENIAGAGGVIAMQTLARAPADGSVLALQTNNMVIAPLLVKPTPYDAAADFTLISIVGAIPLAVVVNASKVSAKDPTEFISLLRSKADTLNYGSSGNGTTQHLAWELVQDDLGVKLNHIPFKGVAPLINDLLAGRVEFAALPIQIVRPHIQSGALRVIAMMSERRAAFAPNVPTLVENGLAQAKMEVWLAVLGPKGMPAAAVRRAHDALLRTFNDPVIKEGLEKQGNTINVVTPEEALAVIRQDMVKYGALAKKINLTGQ